MPYEVVVGNIGTVYFGDDVDMAKGDFKFYVEESQHGTGKAAGESVTLLDDYEVVKKYNGSRLRDGDA